MNRRDMLKIAAATAAAAVVGNEASAIPQSMNTEDKESLMALREKIDIIGKRSMPDAAPKPETPRLRAAAAAPEWFDICGHDCSTRCFDRDKPTESWDVFTFWKVARCWLVFPREVSRERAIESATLILSDRERLGCHLMAEGTKMINEASDARHERYLLKNPESLLRISAEKTGYE